MSKTTSPVLTVVSNGDDWEGLYIDGVLFSEGHSVSVRDLARAIGWQLTKIEVSSDWLGNEVTGLPAKLTDVPETAILP